MTTYIPPGKAKQYLQQQTAQRAKPAHNESALQRECVKWFDMQFAGIYTTYVPSKAVKGKAQRNLRVSLLIMLANASKRSKASASIARAEGLSTGAPDILLAVPAAKAPHHPLWIEFKWGKGKQSDAQKAFEKLALAQGYTYVIIKSFEDFKSTVLNHLGHGI